MLTVFVVGCARLDTSQREMPTVLSPIVREGWKAPPLDPVWRNIRSNPPFVSALMLVDGPPPRVFVDDYFDGFNATVVHFWENGLPHQLAGWNASGRPGLHFFSWLNRDGRSRDGDKVLGAIGANRPGRIGFQIGDEPGLQGQGLTDILRFREGVDAVRAADPNALVVMNFALGVKDLSRILDYAGGVMGIDVFSFDRYNLGKSQYQALGQIRRYAQKYNRPYWRYLYSFRTKESGTRLTASDLRWDAMSGLVYGYTGFTWFIYQDKRSGIVPAFFRQPGFYGAKSPLWREAAQINRKLGTYLRVTTKLWSTDVRYRALLPVLQPDGTRPWQPGAGGDPYLTDFRPEDDPESQGMEILAGFFRDDRSEHYVMLQNVRHTNAGPPNDNEDAGTIRVTLDFTNAPTGVDTSRICVLDPTSGRPMPMAVEKHGRAGGLVRFPLDAGDVVLFKYATGRPFAGFSAGGTPQCPVKATLPAI